MPEDPTSTDLSVLEAGAPASVVTVTGGGVGSDPFDPRSWSGSSYHFFTQLQGQGGLHRAVTAEARPWQRGVALVRNFHRERSAWRRRLYFDTRYRAALTAAAGRRLDDADAHPVLQVGGYYDVPSVVGPGRACFGYFDGTLANRLRDPAPVKGIDSRVLDRVVAFERQMSQGLRKVFTMSDHLRTSFIEDYGVPQDRVVTIGAGVNLVEVPAKDPRKLYDGQEILFIGRGFARKGGPETLEAFAAVRARHPGAVLHMVGPSAPDIPLHQRAGVVAHGPLVKSDPVFRDLFARCTLFVMPSRFDAFGLAPLEAMMHQIPAVVTGEWALKEVVEPGVTGEWVRREDPEHLADVLIEMLREPQRLKVMGEAARQSVVDKFTWDRVVRRLLDEVADSVAATP